MPLTTKPSWMTDETWAFYRQTWVDLGIEVPPSNEKEVYAIRVPGVDEVIHLIPRAKVSPEEMQAHKSALKRGEPSPLSSRQLEYMAWRKDTYFRIKQSATPEEVRKLGWYLNQIENVGDMMTAVYWGGTGILRLLSKLGLKTRGPASKYMGWALAAKDITDIINLFKAARTLRGVSKGDTLKKSGLNPFSTQSKLSRGVKLLKRMPNVPDWIEIAQVTDQFFGVGISFGAIVGFAQDVYFGVKKGARWEWPRGKGLDQSDQ